MGRDAYGSAASVLAIATIIFGVVSQHLSQTLLRLLCTGQKGDVAVGAALLFAVLSMVFVTAAHFLGILAAMEAVQLSTLVVALTFLRICEVQLISMERIFTSILVYYAAPPVLCSVCFVFAGRSGGGFEAAGAAQAIGYAGAAVVAMAVSGGVRPLLKRAIQVSPVAMTRELRRSLPLMISGVSTSAAEFLPMVLLRSMGALGAIPVYEVARKIASIPTTLANPLMNQTNPAIIRAYALQDKDEVLLLMKRFSKRLSWVGVVFAVLVATLVAGGFYDNRIHDVSRLLLPLSLGTIVAMWCVPYQPLLIAAQGDRWFTLSSAFSIVLLPSFTHLFSVMDPALAVSCAAGLSIAASALVIRFRALCEMYPQRLPGA